MTALFAKTKAGFTSFGSETASSCASLVIMAGTVVAAVSFFVSARIILPVVLVSLLLLVRRVKIAPLGSEG